MWSYACEERITVKLLIFSQVSVGIFSQTHVG